MLGISIAIDSPAGIRNSGIFGSMVRKFNTLRKPFREVSFTIGPRIFAFFLTTTIFATLQLILNPLAPEVNKKINEKISLSESKALKDYLWKNKKVAEWISSWLSAEVAGYFGKTVQPYNAKIIAITPITHSLSWIKFRLELGR